MTLYALKPRFQGLLRPLVARLAAAGVTANQVTVAAAAGSVGVALIVIICAEHRAVFLHLNELCDVVSDAALYAPFAMVEPFGPLGIAAVIFLSALTEFAGVLGPTVGASRGYDGPLGKSDRALVFGALGFWVGIGAPLPAWLGWLMTLISLLLVITIINRVRNGLAEAKGQPG